MGQRGWVYYNAPSSLVFLHLGLKVTVDMETEAWKVKEALSAQCEGSFGPSPLPDSRGCLNSSEDRGHQDCQTPLWGRHQKKALPKHGPTSDTPTCTPNMSKCQFFLLCFCDRLQRAALADHAQPACVCSSGNHSSTNLGFLQP